MKRTTYLTMACLLGGLMVTTIISGLQGAAQASVVAVPLANPLDVVINEVAWMGTEASYNDEWIELYNNTNQDINLAGWSIVAVDGTPSISLSGVISANGYFLLERTDDTTVNDIPADQTYTGAMGNDPGENLTLYDDVNQIIDTVNSDGGGWPAGDNGTKQTMERIDPAIPDTDANWCTNDGVTHNGQDADGNLINGTPEAENSCYQPPIADLDIVKTGPDAVNIGSPITYYLTLGNVGTITATGVRITDTLPTGVSFVAQTSHFAFTRLGRTLTWDAGDVGIGTFQITVTGRVAGTAVPTLTLTNRVTATTAATETVTANNTDSWDTTITIPGQADLIVVKTGPAVTKPGNSIVYHIALSNTGTITATDVRLTDTLPTAVNFVTHTSPYTFDRSGGHLIWQLGDVLTDTAHLITVTAQASGDAAFTLTNRITATTTASETITDNNSDAWITAVDTTIKIYLPLILRNYTPPRYGMIVEAVLYDGLQTSDYDEAVLLLNGGDSEVDLTGWELCKMGATDWSCADLPTVTVASRQRLWLARSETYFETSFGFAPDHTLSGWPALSNSGDEVVLRDAEDFVQDALVYEAGNMNIDGWDGVAVQPYGGSNFAKAGQVLYRVLDEETGLAFDDTDTAADWAQHTDDPWHGQRARYPGWDLEQFFQPALGATGAVTVGIAPDNAYQVVVDTIRSAEESIELELYTLEHYGLVTELVQKAQQGISVTVLLEGGPVGGIEDQELWACEQLHNTGNGLCYFMVNESSLNIYDRYSFIHTKFMIVDRERLLVGSQNLTFSSLPDDDKANGTGGSRGVVLVTDAPEMVARAVEIFQADCDPDHHADVSMWGPDNVLGYESPPPEFTPDTGGDWMTYTVQFPQALATTGDWFELVTSPESALRSSDALLGLVAQASAGDAVYVQQLYEYPDWGDNPTDSPNLRIESYIAAARRGAMVRILLNGGDFGIEYLSLTNNIETAAYVNVIAQAEGLDMSAHLGDPTQHGIHNKMVLVDLGGGNKYAHVGSINGSETSNKVNREMALQVRSTGLYNYLYSMFDYDWQQQAPGSHLLISEVLYNPSGGDTGQEWVEVYNPTIEHVNLSGWYLGDVGPAGEYGSGLYYFPPGAVLVAEGVIVIAHQAADVSFTPDFEFLLDPNRDDPSVPNMERAGSWDGFGFALGNAGDEVLLLDATQAPVDVVTYGTGSYTGVIPHPGVSDQGHSLERRPPKQDSDDCSQDFFDRVPPTPGELPE
ncbi:MAG: DUF11 domain-containing protein [Chloroflexi bacterium]|nr:DUF11 domain-containing protein [Chloroflexota bacterium]